MINSEASKSNINGNEESIGQLDRESGITEDLPGTYIPSYIGLSCAVSGYRSINKYDGLVHENSPSVIATRLPFLCGHCKDASNSLYNEESPKHSPYLDNVISSTPGLCTSRSCLKDKMNISSENCSQFMRIQHQTDVGNSVRITTESVSCFTKETEDEKGRKSFVQQRIERLYGPTAHGVTFQTKKSFLEQLNGEDRLEGKNNSHKIEENSSKQFPSVFRHLRPEFIHQLPVKSKISDNSLKTDFIDGYSVQINNLKSKFNESPKDSNKSWKSLSKELENVCKPTQDASTCKSETRIASSSPLKELTNNDIPELTSLLSNNSQKKEDGNYFLEVMAREIKIFESELEKIEKDLNCHGEKMSEDVKGKLLATTGKAKLLINKKFKQFEGLCLKNVSACPEGEFPTTNEDLAGFWDMVIIQIDHIKELFKEGENLRLSNWQESATPALASGRPVVKKSNAVRKPQTNGSDLKKESNRSEKNDSAGEERRKQMRQMLNAKRKQINQTKCTNVSEDVEIFVHNK